MHEALTMLPEVHVRRLLADRPLRLQMLCPPYPALGVGTLRVLRIRERGSALDLVAGYENYERLD